MVINEFPFPVSIDRIAATGRRFRLFDLLPGKEKAFDAWTGMTLIATDLLDGTEYRFLAATDALDGTEYRFVETTDGKWRLRPRK
jgi:hypothetical protein